MLRSEYDDTRFSPYGGLDMVDVLERIKKENGDDWNFALASAKNVVSSILVMLKGRDYARKYYSFVINDWPPFPVPDEMLDGVADYIAEQKNEQKVAAIATLKQAVQDAVMATPAPRKVNLSVDVALGLDEIANRLGKIYLGPAKMVMLVMGAQRAVQRGSFDYK